MRYPHPNAIALASCLFLMGPRWTEAAIVYGNESINSKMCDTVEWTDANGKARKVWIVRGDGDRNGFKGGYIERYSYYIDDTQKTGQAWNAAQEYVSGLGCAVNHHATSSTSKRNSANQQTGFQLKGANHCIWRFTGDYSGPNTSNVTRTIKLVIDFCFWEGRNDFGWAVSYDCSGIPRNDISWDARGPYFQFDWDGNDSFYSDPISGIRWADKYKFRTTTFSAATSAWDYTQPNVIPHTVTWKDANSGNLEAGVVATQTWAQKDHGGYWWHANWGKTGSGMPQNWNCPYQMNAYESYNGEKVAWGAMFGYVGSSHYDEMGFAKKRSGYPHQGYAVTIILNKYTEGLTDRMIGSMESVQGTTMTASKGAVVTSGQQFIGIPSHATYQPAGWDHIHGAWAARSDANNAVTVSLNISSGTLMRPLFKFENYTAATAPSTCALNGASLVSGTDYFATLDDSNDTLWMTLARNLSGDNELEIGGAGPGTTSGGGGSAGAATSGGLTAGAGTSSGSGSGTTGNASGGISSSGGATGQTSGGSVGQTTASTSGNSSGASDGGGSTASGTTGATGSGGSTARVLDDWNVIVTRPKLGRRVRVKGGIIRVVAGKILGHGLNPGTRGVTVEVAVGSTGTAAAAWQEATRVSAVTKRREIRWRAFQVAGAPEAASGPLLIHSRATPTDFAIETSATFSIECTAHSSR